MSHTLLSQNSTSPSETFIKFDKAEIEQSIPARFEQQATRFPDRIAVRYKAQAITYTDLNRSANRVAWAILHELGPEAEPVILLLDQGSLLVIAILGLLKAGKFYVPLDPVDPPTRNATVLAEVRPRLVITDRAHLELAQQLAQSEACQVLNLEALDPTCPAENPGLSLGPESLAYIFFTSGSTGRPKGVIDNHRNVLHNVFRYTNTLHLSAADRLSLIQAPTFSGTVSSLFGALLNGGTICPHNFREEGPAGLAAWLNEAGVTVYHSVPMIFRSFLKGDLQFPTVRLIRLEGDRASRLDVELYQRYFSPTCILVNGLGTTETGLCRQLFINKGSSLTDNILPVGYPVEDMEIMLLDEVGQPVGVNQVGQIAVKSRYLSLGYWQQPELTGTAFSPDPQGGEERVYQTGDTGRLRPDGCLEYLGRQNFQLKIRGQRVEPAEVEQALLDLSFIREAAVTTREDAQGEARLIAYLVSSPESTPPVSEIRRLLRQNLPDALIPTGYVFLDQLPVTDNGKVDRRALPDPVEPQPVSTAPFVAPNTPFAQTIAAIWAEVFDLQRVGLDDDFFGLGGDSIKAMQILSRLRERLKVEVPFRTLLDAPRLADFIDQIEKQ